MIGKRIKNMSNSAALEHSQIEVDFLDSVYAMQAHGMKC